MNRWTGGRLALATACAAMGLAFSGSSASAFSLFPHLRVPQQATFGTDVQLQGIYDEMSEVYVPAMTPEDVHLYDQTVFTPNWVFVSASGHSYTQAQMAAREARAPVPDSTEQLIQSITPVPGGVNVLVTMTTVRSIVDRDGRYGAPGATHALTEATPFADHWVKTPDGWRMTSREQLGPTRTILDQPEWGL